MGQCQGQWLLWLLQLPAKVSFPLVFATSVSFLTPQTVGRFILSFLTKQKLNSWPGKHALSPFALFASQHHHAAISTFLPPLNTHLPSSFNSITAYSFPTLFFSSPTVLPFTSIAHCHQLTPPSPFILNSTSLVQSSLSILSKIFPSPVLILEVCWYHHYSTFIMHCLMSKVREQVISSISLQAF